MKNIIPAALFAVSTLGACTNKTAESTLASKHEEITNVLKSVGPEKDTSTFYGKPIVFGDTMEADRKEEFITNGGTTHGDTTTTKTTYTPEDSADIYYEEFIKPGPH